ncbi:hypothetical protein WAK64_07040 [Bacillus spongiae]|uniref:ABC transporter permease n=1 Tax=Bacillus spongiae TaxID=2683610 RepID=A0ABU8HBV3_9BACI
MYKELKAVLYYFLLDYRFSLGVFWTILISSLIGFSLIGLIGDGIGNVVIVTSLPVLIYCIVSGINMTKETFPFCIKMGVTRHQYMLGSALFTLLLSVGMSLVHLIISYGYDWLLKLGSIEGITHYSLLQFFSLSNTWFNELWLLAFLNFVFLGFGILFGTIIYRYGLVGGFSTVAVLVFLFVLPTSREALIERMLLVNNGQLSIQFGFLFVLTSIVFFQNWLLIRKASTMAASTR